MLCSSVSAILFLSTPSARRATIRRASVDPDIAISIHALREEGDQDIPLVPLIDDNFYPRPPRGGRLIHVVSPPDAQNISIHALREEGDDVQASLRDFMRISIHALREEGDTMPGYCGYFSNRFLSTPSARRATSS